MGFNSQGAYAQIAGAITAAPGQTIQSAVWNAIHTDLGLALSQGIQEFMYSPANRNLLWMNGGLEVWQRGADSTSNFSVLAANTAYTVDRWYLTTGANQNSTVSFQSGLVSQSRSSARVQRTNGQTGTTTIYFAYPLDTDEIIRMRGKNVTLTFTIQAGANWSPTSGTIGVAIPIGTGATPAKRGGTPYAGEVFVINTAFNLTQGGASVTIAVNSSVTVPTNGTQAEVIFYCNPIGTAGANDWFQIDDVQLEVNAAPNFTWIPTAYDRMTFPQMLEGCKRHYQKTPPLGTFAAQACGRPGSLMVISNAASRVGIYWSYPVEIRATGTITAFNPDGANNNWQNITAAATSAATIDTSTQG